MQLSSKHVSKPTYLKQTVAISSAFGLLAAGVVMMPAVAAQYDCDPVVGAIVTTLSDGSCQIKFDLIGDFAIPSTPSWAVNLSAVVVAGGGSAAAFYDVAAGHPFGPGGGGEVKFVDLTTGSGAINVKVGDGNTDMGFDAHSGGGSAYDGNASEIGFESGIVTIAAAGKSPNLNPWSSQGASSTMGNAGATCIGDLTLTPKKPNRYVAGGAGGPANSGTCSSGPGIAIADLKKDTKFSALWSQDSITTKFGAGGSIAGLGLEANTGAGGNITKGNSWSDLTIGASGTVIVRYATPAAPIAPAPPIPPLGSIDLYADLDAGDYLSGGTGAVDQVIPSTGNYTVEAWVKPDAFVANSDPYKAIVSQNQDGGGADTGRFFLGLQQSATRHYGIHLGIGGAETVNSLVYPGDGIPVGSWSHIAVSVDQTSSPKATKLYLNGIELLSVAAGAGSSNNVAGFSIGATGGTATHLFDGGIDQVKIWGGALTKAQIDQSMHAWGATGVTGTPPELSKHFDFNGGLIEGAIRSVSSAVQELTAVGAPLFPDVVETKTSNAEFSYIFNRSYLTSSGEWAFPSEFPAYDAIVAGAGGAGEADGGGGGSGGELRQITARAVSGTGLDIKVGQGGIGGRYARGAFVTLPASAGQVSSLGDVVANAGNPGPIYNGTAGAVGGTGGGGASTSSSQGKTGAFPMVVCAANTPSANSANATNKIGITGTAANLNGSIYGSSGGGGIGINGIALASVATTELLGNFGGANAGNGAFVERDNDASTGFSALANFGGGGGGGAACNPSGWVVADNGLKTRTDGGHGGSGVVIIAIPRPAVPAGPVSSVDLYADLASGDYFVGSRTTAARVVPSTGSYTVEAWVKPDATGSNNAIKTIVSQNQFNGNQVGRFYLGLVYKSTPQKFGITLQLGDTTHDVSGPDQGYVLNVFPGDGVPAGSWSHIAVSTDRSVGALSTKIYLNGVLVFSEAKGLGSNNNVHGFAIGSDGGGGGQIDFDGGIDQVKIWDGALTKVQIDQSMHAWASEGVASAPNLRKHFDFNAGLASPSTIQAVDGSGLELQAVGTSAFKNVAETSIAGGELSYIFNRSYLTSSGEWGFPAALSSFRAIVAGAGGGGGSDGGGGGGGGQLLEVANRSATGTGLAINVGQGGIGGKHTGTPAYPATSGQVTSFKDTLIVSASAGARGHGWSSGVVQARAAGGSGGAAVSGITQFAGKSGGLGPLNCSVDGAFDRGDYYSSTGTNPAGITGTIASLNSLTYGSSGGGGIATDSSVAVNTNATIGNLGGTNAGAGAFVEATNDASTGFSALANLGGGGGGGVACGGGANGITTRTDGGHGGSGVVIISFPQGSGSAVTVTAADSSRAYGELTPSIGFTSSVLAGGDWLGEVVCSAKFTITSPASESDVATRSATTASLPAGQSYKTSCQGPIATGLGVPINYVPGTFAITARPITIQIKNQVTNSTTVPTRNVAVNTSSSLVDGEFWLVSSGSIVDGDRITIALTYPTSTVTSGTFVTTVMGKAAVLTAVTAGSETEVNRFNSTKNYDITFVDGFLTYSNLTYVITGKPSTKVYGDTKTFDNSTDWTCSELPACDTALKAAGVGVTVDSTGAASTAAPGAYSIATAVTAPPAGTEIINADGGQLTVVKRQLTITPDTRVVQAGSTVPSPSSYTFKIQGFAPGEGLGNLATPPVCSSTYSVTTLRGTTVAITCSGGAGANYDFAYVRGYLNVPGGSNITDGTDRTQNLNHFTSVKNVEFDFDISPAAATCNANLRVTNSSGVVQTSRQTVTNGQPLQMILPLAQGSYDYTLGIDGNCEASPISRSLTVGAAIGSPPVANAPTEPPMFGGVSERALDACKPQNITVTGSKLQGVTPSINGLKLKVTENTDTKLVMVVPAGLTPGMGVDLVLVGPSNLRTVAKDVFDIPAGQCDIVASKGNWTKLFGQKSIKFYSKSPIGEGKIQFIVDGKEIAWIRAVDAADPKLSFASGYPYLVRTYELKPGKNRLEIRVDGKRVWRATYVPRN